MPRSELLAKPQTPAAFRAWIEARRRLLGIKRAQFDVLIAEERGKLNVARNNRSESLRLDTVVRQTVALRALERRLNVAEQSCSCVAMGLLAAGLYIDYAVVLGTMFEQRDSMDILAFIGAVECATMHGSELAVGGVPNVSDFLNRWAKIQSDVFNAAVPIFDSTFEQWKTMRRWENVPKTTLAAVACFNARQNADGLVLLRESGLTAARTVVATSSKTRVETPAKEITDNETTLAGEAGLMWTLAWCAEQLRLPGQSFSIAPPPSDEQDARPQ